MSQMNNKNWKPGSSPTGKANQAMDKVKQAVGNLNRAEHAVQTAGPGQHNNALKNLQHADQANTSAQNNYMAAKKLADKPKSGLNIGANRTPQPKPTTGAPKTGIGNSGAKPLMGKLGNMLGKKK